MFEIFYVFVNNKNLQMNCCFYYNIYTNNKLFMLQSHVVLLLVITRSIAFDTFKNQNNLVYRMFELANHFQ